MKATTLLLVIVLTVLSCKSVNTKPIVDERKESLVKNDTVVIDSDENAYEIIIIEPGFNAWLQSTARPRHYYSQEFLETRNQIYVTNWNIRVSQPLQFNPNLYQLAIDYNKNEDYGYEINYKLYNYFVYFQLTYNQKLGPFFVRI